MFKIQLNFNFELLCLYFSISDSEYSSSGNESIENNLKEFPINMAKLLLNYSVTRLPIKRQEIIKHIFNGTASQKRFSDVFKRAKDILKNVSKIQTQVYCVINLDCICRSMD